MKLPIGISVSLYWMVITSEFLGVKYNLKMQGENYHLLLPSVWRRGYIQICPLSSVPHAQTFGPWERSQGADVYFSCAGRFGFLQRHEVSRPERGPLTHRKLTRWTVGKLGLSEHSHPGPRKEPKCDQCTKGHICFLCVQGGS